MIAPNRLKVEYKLGGGGGIYVKMPFPSFGRVVPVPFPSCMIGMIAVDQFAHHKPVIARDRLIGLGLIHIDRNELMDPRLKPLDQIAKAFGHHRNTPPQSAHRANGGYHAR